jgi:polyisoprenoid-binding protein YceI
MTTTALNDLVAGTWAIDPSHSSVGFTARHLMISKVRGSFPVFSGTLTIGSDPLQSSVQATIDVSSVSTGDEGRDGHLKGADFFDVVNFPQMTFSSTGVQAKGDDFVLVGDLTIKGVTKSVSLDLEFDGVAKDPWGNTKAGFTASGNINRKDWGLEWNVALEAGGVLVSENITLKLDIQAVKPA